MLSLSVPRRFNGPLDSANGGYSAGAIAGFVDGPAEVSLRRPVPLDTPVDVVRDADGSVTVLAGRTLIAEGRPAPALDIAVPAPVRPAEAEQASTRYRAPSDGIFCRCFVCGRAREDAVGVFAGAVDGRDVVASPWTPPAWTVGADGSVLREIVWATLDCPTYFALYTEGELPLSFLGRMTARIDAPVVAGDEHVVIGWPIAKDGRKHSAGSAVLSPDGDVLAVAHALLIAPRA